MKSHVDILLDIYDGIFLDAATRWPTSIKDFRKDITCLRKSVEERGFAFLAITLPSTGKILDRGLDNGYLSFSDIPNGVPIRMKRPKFLRAFLNRVFDSDGTLRDDACVDSVLFLRQILYLAKSYRIECPPQAVKETLNEFFQIEAHLPPVHEDTFSVDIPKWSRKSGHPIWGEQTNPCPESRDLFRDSGSHDIPFHWDTLRAIARKVTSEMGTPEWWDLVPKHGPGIVSDDNGGVKYDFPHWPRKLELWFPYDWFGSGSLSDDQSWPSDREPPSSLRCVPKSFKGPRLIAAEPTAHQWIQQSIWRWLRDRVHRGILRNTIRFDSQERSRERALNASLSGDHCTIDLSSASDRLSCRLVEYIFQGSEILDGLHACRTRLLRQDISDDYPSVIALRKFSTQGSALTFPIQSIVFSILTVFALRMHEGKQGIDGLEDDLSRITVFGDDIIAPNSAYPTIKLILHECGLKVNDTKSYCGSFFRESCGMDAFKGYDVTPATFLQSYDGSAELTASTIETSNNLFKKGFWNASSIVLGQIPQNIISNIPVDDGKLSGLGLFSFCGSHFEHLRRVWNKDLQKEEFLVLAILNRVTRKRGTGSACLTQYFTEAPPADHFVKWQAGQVSRVKVRKALTRV